MDLFVWIVIVLLTIGLLFATVFALLAFDELIHGLHAPHCTETRAPPRNLRILFIIIYWISSLTAANLPRTNGSVMPIALQTTRTRATCAAR